MIFRCKNCNKEYDVDITKGNWNKNNIQVILKGKGSGSKVVRSDLFCSYECGKEFINNKIKLTNMMKYGVENPFQNEEIKDKIKQSIKQKYNVYNVSQSDEIKELKKQTFKNNYGCDYGQSLEVNEKRKETCLKKYGVACALKSSVVRNKIKNTCLNKYGVENPFGSIEIKNKIKNTYLTKYGVTSNMQVPELYEKNLKSRTDNGVSYCSKMETAWLDMLKVKNRQNI